MAKRTRKIPEIITGRETYLIKKDHWILPKLKTLQLDYCFFYHIRYNCWILYKYVSRIYSTKLLSPSDNAMMKSYRGKYIRIWDCQRQPGYWLYYHLLKSSLVKGRVQEGLKRFEEYLEAPSEAEINSWNNQREIYNEMNKDLELAKTGRCSIQLSNTGFASVERNKKKKKKIFVGIKTGRILGYG